jgi:hypothetical protein
MHLFFLRAHNPKVVCFFFNKADFLKIWDELITKKFSMINLVLYLLKIKK